MGRLRDAEATHILVGKVKAVYERKLQTGRQGRGTIEGHYLVEILDAAALHSKATRPVVTYEWPPWVEDLDADQPGAQSGFDIKAEDPYPKRRKNPDLRYIRMRIAPGRNADGSLRKIRSFRVHFHGGFLLTRTPGEPSFQDRRNAKRVTHLYWTRNPGPTGPVDIPVQLPRAR